MANETITFLCPACGIKLTVPSQLAGVTGPCPSCRSQIQAPYLTPVPSPIYPSSASPASDTLPEVAQAYQSPTSVAAPAAYEPISTPLPVATPPDYPAPPVQPVIVPIQEQAAPPSTSIPRPEPRQLPIRANPVEPASKQITEPSYLGTSSSDSNTLPRHYRHPTRSARFLMLLIAVGAIVFGVLTFLKRQSEDEPGMDPRVEIPARKILPDEPMPPAMIDEMDDGSAPPVELPTIIQPLPSLPDGLISKSPAETATEVLDQFLTAKTLAERLPLIETLTPEAELAKSCLAGPLPAASNILIDAVDNNPVEQVADLYHSVDFDAGDNRKNPQTILVRTRGSGKPKVVVDPFLDSYGGRLAGYARAPSEKAGIFQVIIWPLAACYDENVPNRDKKLTLKLLPRDNAKEITQAYFGKQSKIAQLLEDGNYSLGFGKAKACTVMLRWNVEERPGTPYLEAIDIKKMDWNP